MNNSYLWSVLWLTSWPVVILCGVLFSRLNLKHYAKLEKLEELENKLPKENLISKPEDLL